MLSTRQFFEGMLSIYISHNPSHQTAGTLGLHSRIMRLFLVSFHAHLSSFLVLGKQKILLFSVHYVTSSKLSIIIISNKNFFHLIHSIFKRTHYYRL